MSDWNFDSYCEPYSGENMYENGEFWRKFSEEMQLFEDLEHVPIQSYQSSQ